MCAGMRRIGGPSKATEAIDSAASRTGAQPPDGSPASTRAVSVRPSRRNCSTRQWKPIAATPSSARRSTTYVVGSRPPVGTDSTGSESTAAGAATTAVVWVVQADSSPSAIREDSRTIPSWCTTCRYRAAVTLTGTRRATSVSSGRAPTSVSAAVRKVFSSTAAGRISTPRTGWSPGYGRESRSR